MQIDFSAELCQDWDKLKAAMDERGNNGGVYRVHACGSSTENFKPTQRLLKQDPFGRLYIGMAASFTERFIVLLKSLRPDMKTLDHDFAVDYNSVPAVMALYPLETLHFTLRFSPTPRITESAELEAYRQEFGELPPFNMRL